MNQPLQKTIFITLLGITPLAIENSLLLFFKNYQNRFLHQLLLFTSQEGLNSICQMYDSTEHWLEKIAQDAQKMNLENIPSKILFELHTIDEYELELIRTEIFAQTSKILSKCSSISNIEIVIDITGGRKAMSIGAFLAALRIEYTFPNIPVFVSYYWLKQARGKYLHKSALDLFRDEYEIRLWKPLQAIDVEKNKPRR